MLLFTPQPSKENKKEKHNRVRYGRETVILRQMALKEPQRKTPNKNAGQTASFFEMK